MISCPSLLSRFLLSRSPFLPIPRFSHLSTSLFPSSDTRPVYGLCSANGSIPLSDILDFLLPYSECDVADEAAQLEARNLEWTDTFSLGVNQRRLVFFLMQQQCEFPEDFGDDGPPENMPFSEILHLSLVTRLQGDLANLWSLAKFCSENDVGDKDIPSTFDSLCRDILRFEDEWAKSGPDEFAANSFRRSFDSTLAMNANPVTEGGVGDINWNISGLDSLISGVVSGFDGEDATFGCAVVGDRVGIVVFRPLEGEYQVLECLGAPGSGSSPMPNLVVEDGQLISAFEIAEGEESDPMLDVSTACMELQPGDVLFYSTRGVFDHVSTSSMCTWLEDISQEIGMENATIDESIELVNEFTSRVLNDAFRAMYLNSLDSSLPNMISDMVGQGSIVVEPSTEEFARIEEGEELLVNSFAWDDIEELIPQLEHLQQAAGLVKTTVARILGEGA